MRQLKKIFSSLLACAITLSFFIILPVVNNTVYAASSITRDDIDRVCNAYGFKSGKYWTYNFNNVSKTKSALDAAATSSYTASDTPYGDCLTNQYYSSGKKNHGIYQTNSNREYTRDGNGSKIKIDSGLFYGEYVFHSSVQCYAFADFIGYQITGSYPSSDWTHYTTKTQVKNAGGLQVGDVIRADGHSAMVLTVSGGTFTTVECWGSQKSRNKISYNGKFNSRINTLDGLTNFEYVARYSGSVYGSPSNTWITASCGSTVNKGSAVTLNWGADNARSYWLHIWKDGVDYLSVGQNNSTSWSGTFSQLGFYECYITPYGKADYVSPEGPNAKVTFTVVEPTSMFDVNFKVNNSEVLDISDIGYVDVYIDGVLKGSGGDFYQAVPIGKSYEVMIHITNSNYTLVGSDRITGTTSSVGNSVLFNIVSNCPLTINFVVDGKEVSTSIKDIGKISYSINNGSNSISFGVLYYSGTRYLAPGDIYELKAYATNSNYVVLGTSSIKGTMIENGASYTFHFATAYNLNSNAVNGTVNLSPDTKAAEGQVITVNATPDTGYELVAIIVNDVEISGNTFVMPANDVNVSAIFRPALEIVTQPESFVGAPGDLAEFTVEAEGEGLKYQWQVLKTGTWTNCSINDGAKTSTLTLEAKESRNGLKYRCIVTDKNGCSVISDEVTLTAAIPFTITTQPKDFSEYAGETATFTVKAEGDGIKYQWQVLKNGTWNNCSINDGARTNTLSLLIKDSRDGSKYQCVVTNKYGETLTSDEVTLTVKKPLAITSQPTDFSGEIGETAKFIVEAQGEGLKYQWQVLKNGTWTNCSINDGAKTNTLSLEIKESRNGCAYHCIVTDQTGAKATSNEVSLYVVNELLILSEPQYFYGAIGETALFEVEAQGDGLKYQWQVLKNGEWVNCSMNDGARTNTLTLEIKASRDGSQYHCVITDKYGNRAETRTVYIYLEQAVPAPESTSYATTSDATVAEAEETVDAVEPEVVEVFDTVEEAVDTESVA